VQLEERAEAGLGLPRADGLIFTDEQGGPIHPNICRGRSRSSPRRPDFRQSGCTTSGTRTRRCRCRRACT
jgi:hypothetical protein